MSIAKERVLVTGGAGFIGSNLVASLLKQGHEVVVLDNFWTGSPLKLYDCRENPDCRLLQADVTDPIPESARASQIFHLACPASPIQFTKDPLGILDACYKGTRNVLEAGWRWNARVLLASTSEVYGQPTQSPQNESYLGNVNCFGPRACYDEGKRVAEALGFAYRQQHGLDIRIARIFNAYGPGMHASDGRAVSSFIAAALEGQELVINGDGKSTRCFQYVTDCVEGLQRLMRSDWQGGPINIGSEHEVAIQELAVQIARMVAQATKKPSATIVYKEALPDDPLQRRPDCALARKVLSWQPEVSLEDGLKQTIHWHLQSNEDILLQRL